MVTEVMQLDRYLIKIENESAEMQRRRLYQFCYCHTETIDGNRSRACSQRAGTLRHTMPSPALWNEIEPDAETLWVESKTQIDL